MRWRFILPSIGLILFAGVSYDSLRMNREGGGSHSRYFWWSSVRLDSDPRNRHPHVAAPCEAGTVDCWDPQYIWIDPGWLTKVLLVSALPAFGIDLFVIRGFASSGMSEITSFFASMPLLIGAWFYFVGLLIDRWRHKRSLPV